MKIAWLPAVARLNVAFERQRRILDDTDCVAVAPQKVVDGLPAGTVHETTVNENCRPCSLNSTHDGLLHDTADRP